MILYYYLHPCNMSKKSFEFLIGDDHVILFYHIGFLLVLCELLITVKLVYVLRPNHARQGDREESDRILVQTYQKGEMFRP